MQPGGTRRKPSADRRRDHDPPWKKGSSAWPTSIHRPVRIRWEIDRTQRRLVGTPEAESVRVRDPQRRNARQWKIAQTSGGKAGAVKLGWIVNDFRRYSVVR